MSDTSSTVYINMQQSDNQIINEDLNLTTKDTLVLTDSARLSPLPITVYYNEQYQYPKFNVEGLNAVPAAEPLQFVDKDPKFRETYGFINTAGFNFGLLLLLLLYFAYSLRGKFERTLQAIWSSPKLERFYNEKELRNPLFFWLVYISISLSATFPILSIVEHYPVQSIYAQYIPRSVWAMGLDLILFHIVYFVVAYLFLVMTNHYKHFGFWFLSRGIVMWPVSVIFTLLFGIIHVFGWNVQHAAFLFLLIYIMAYLKFLSHTYYMVKERGFSISVWILYLCALELFPMIALLSISWDVVTI